MASRPLAGPARVPRLVVLAAQAGGGSVSRTASIQLGLLPGFDGPLLPAAPIVIENPSPPPRRSVSAERELLAAQVSMAISQDPPDIEGWQEELGQERPRIGPDGVCTAVERWRRRTDGTIGPCPWLGCPRHTLLDYGPVVTIGGGRRAEILLNRGDEDGEGRRPALPTVPTDGEADAFALEALDRLDRLADTCIVDAMAKLGPTARAEDAEEAVGGVETPDEEERALAVAVAARLEQHRQRADAIRVRSIAKTLGLSEEQIRIDTLSAAAKLGIKMVNGQPRPGDGAQVEALLARHGDRALLSDQELAERRRRVIAFLLGADRDAPADPRQAVATIERALVAPPMPITRIRRIEREAPPPKEPTADEVFTF